MGMEIELIGVGSTTLLMLLELEGHGINSELVPFGSQTGPLSRADDRVTSVSYPQ